MARHHDSYSRPGLPDFSWNSVPKRGELYQIATYIITKWPWHVQNSNNIFQMAQEYTKLLHSKALFFSPNWDFLVWKYIIWQPCSCPGTLSFENWLFQELKSCLSEFLHPTNIQQNALVRNFVNGLIESDINVLGDPCNFRQFESR
jgi:hypothetical protein